MAKEIKRKVKSKNSPP
jgi:hypothetical protein